MAFTKPKSNQTPYATPGELYRNLPRRPGAVSGLWAHQSQMLKEYTEDVNQSDIALELPTGTGKTLIGLLIAEWNRQRYNQQVLYACPTRQLADQVYDAASREGIDVTLLTGSHADWPPNSRVQYEAAQRIGVTTYNSIFNSNPKLADPSVILFDDAHAGEQYVAEAYSISLSRKRDPSEYRQILKIISPAINEVFFERLQAEDPDPGIIEEVRLVLPLRQPKMTRNLTAALSALKKPHSYRFTMIRQGIASCLIYVSFSEILIRPYIPPTSHNRLFNQARQRVYLSATLGEGGELERAFGRYNIKRLRQPDEDIAPRSGRRFFVFPEFISNSDAWVLTRDIVAQAGKALVLSQRITTATEDAKKMAQSSWPILGSTEDASTSMKKFIEAKHAICALAARYDGLDLPGKVCQLIVFDGTPDQLNLQERFLQRNAQAGVALGARVRTRIIQGGGRCTRGPEDAAIVLIMGSLSNYLVRPETLGALTPELQAEIKFGLLNSQNGTREDMFENVCAFLNQDTDDTWRTEAEPTLIEYRRQAVQNSSPGSQQLSDCVDKEINAWASAYAGSWKKAALHARAVCNTLGNGGNATRKYQAFWKYLEAAWTDMAAEESGNSLEKATSRQLLAEAAKQAGGSSWIDQMAQFPEMVTPALNCVDGLAAKNVATLLDSSLNENKQHDRLGRMQENLAQKDANKFESALSVLGQLLGAEAKKPAKHGRCDSTWCWGNELWFALEAKSEHIPTGVISIKDLRQSNDQLKLLADDRTCTAVPPNSAVIIISPKPGVHHDAITIANDCVYLTHPATIRAIAADTATAWNRLLAGRAGKDTDSLRTFAAQTLRGFGLLPSDLCRRLTDKPIGRTN